MYTTFNTGYLWGFPRKPEWSDMEWQVRNWYYFTWLSGDHLVEQAVHNCDKMFWAMNDKEPARAMAIGGRQVRVEPNWGQIYDHFGVVYEWADGTRGFLFARQQERCANDVSDHFMGTLGNADLGSGAGHVITGAEPVEVHRREGQRPPGRAFCPLQGPARRQALRGWRSHRQEHDDLDHGANGRLHRSGDHLGAGDELAGEPGAGEAGMGTDRDAAGADAGEDEVLLRG